MSEDERDEQGEHEDQPPGDAVAAEGEDQLDDGERKDGTDESVDHGNSRHGGTTRRQRAASVRSTRLRRVSHVVRHGDPAEWSRGGRAWKPRTMCRGGY